VLEICQRSQVVINSCPMIRKGLHERALLGIISGATLVTSSLSLLPQWLDSVVTYTTSTLDTLPERMAAVQKKNWYESLLWAEKKHTWEARLKKLLPLLNSLLCQVDFN